MQLDRIASEYVLELQLTPSGQANESADFFWNESAFCACVKATFWSNLSKRAFARSFAWAKFQMLEVRCLGTPDDPFPSRTNHRVVIAKYYITLASTRRRTLQYYRSARLALAKWAYLRSLQCGQKPKDRMLLPQVRQSHFPAQVLHRLTSLRHPLPPCCVLAEETRSGCALRVVV
jgi:hypothetical protein